MNRMWLIITAAAWMSGAAAATGQKEAGNPNPGVVAPIHASVAGKTYGQWAGDWYNWGLNHGSTNPVSDETGQYCAVGQSAKVWFLAGTFGNEDLVNRQCAVPSGKFLFFPALNAWITMEGTNEEMKARIKAFIDSASEVLVRVDGKIVQNVTAYRVASRFTLTLTADNAFGVPEYAGEYDPTFQEGIYLMLNPLTPGFHTVEIFATAAGVDGDPLFGPFTVNVLYQLMVSNQ